MLAHLHPFLGSQLVRLAQDRVGNADLPHVVEQSAAVDVCQLGLHDPHATGHRHRIGRDAQRVTECLGVARVEGRRQRLQGRLIGGLETVEKLLHFPVLPDQLGGALGYPGLECSLVLPIFANQPPLLQSPLDRDPYLGQVERLREVVVGSEAHGLDGGVHVDDPRQHDDFGVGMSFLDLLEELHAVHLGHVNVAYDQLEGARSKFPKTFRAVARRLAAIAAAGETLREEIADDRVVIDDEDVD